MINIGNVFVSYRMGRPGACLNEFGGCWLKKVYYSWGYLDRGERDLQFIVTGGNQDETRFLHPNWHQWFSGLRVYLNAFERPLEKASNC